MTEDRPEGKAALAGVARQLIGEFAAAGARLRSYAEVDEVLADLARVCLPASSAAAEAEFFAAGEVEFGTSPAGRDGAG